MNGFNFMVDMKDLSTTSSKKEFCACSSDSRMKRKTLILDIQALRSICNYCHWIPLTRGLHIEYFNLHFPGWQWNDLIPQLIKMGILKFRNDSSDQIHLTLGLYISPNIECIEFIPTNNGSKITVKLFQEGNK